MSKVQVDTIVDKDDVSAPTFSKGAIVTGVCTATTFVGALTGNADTATTATTTSGNAGGLTGTPNITVGNVTSANVTNSKQTTSEHVNVTGISTLGGDVSIADKIIHTGDTDTAIRFADADTITAETGGSERVRVDSSGRIGIGTAPYGSTGALHVYEPTNDRTLILDSGNTNGSHIRLWRQGAVQHYIGCSAGFGQGDYEDLGIRAKDNIIFHPGDSSTERLRIGASGEIGLSGANYGTSGQVLTSGGSGAAASWADAAGGAWESLTSGTFSSSDGSGVDIYKTISTTHLTSSHKFYKLSMLFSLDSTSWETGLQVYSGGAWQESSYTYEMHGQKNGSHDDSSRGAQTRIHFGDDNWYSKVYQVEIFFSDVDTSNGRRYFKLSGMSNNSTNSYSNKSIWNMFGSWDSTGTITGIRVKATQSGGSSGEFDHGWYVLEGCAIS